MQTRVANELKKHFRATDIRISNTGGGKKWECRLCDLPITGSATKLRAHLFGIRGEGVTACPNVDADILRAITALEEQFPAGGRQPASSLGLSSSSSSRLTSIAEAFERLNKDEVDQAIALWFYVNGIPFNVVRYVSYKGHAWLPSISRLRRIKVLRCICNIVQV